MEKMEFLQIFQEVCLAYRMPLNEKETTVYYKYLCQYSAKEFAMATSNIITNIKYKYFPKINEYIMECDKARRTLNLQQKKLNDEKQIESQDMQSILEFFKN